MKTVIIQPITDTGWYTHPNFLTRRNPFLSLPSKLIVIIHQILIIPVKKNIIISRDILFWLPITDPRDDRTFFAVWFIDKFFDSENTSS